MRTIAIIIALAVGASGCAIAAANGPGPVTLAERPDCNRSKGAVVADGLAAGVLGLGAIGTGAAEETTAALVLGVIAAAYTGSAVAGNRSADRCIEANNQYDVLVQRRLDEMGTQRVADEEDEASARAGSTDDEVEPEPIAAVKPPPVVATRPPVPTPAPVPAPRAPTPTPAPAAAARHDDDGEDDEATAADGDWSEFWREVTP